MDEAFADLVERLAGSTVYIQGGEYSIDVLAPELFEKLREVAQGLVLSSHVAAWPVELGYDGEALCARCLQPLRGPDGLRLGGSGSVTLLKYVVLAVAEHREQCPDAGLTVEYHDHTPKPVGET